MAEGGGERVYVPAGGGERAGDWVLDLADCAAAYAAGEEEAAAFRDGEEEALLGGVAAA